MTDLDMALDLLKQLLSAIEQHDESLETIIEKAKKFIVDIESW